jgi:AraC-like DNA-binding protein
MIKGLPPLLYRRGRLKNAGTRRFDPDVNCRTREPHPHVFSRDRNEIYGPPVETTLYTDGGEHRQRAGQANCAKPPHQGLMLMQPHNYTDALSKHANSPARGAVMRAIELMRAHPETSWTTGKLAQTVGVSARALQKGFARSDELPPMTYLRYLRLHRAHSELLDAHPRSVTVTAVASGWGFLHFGRFAQQYCQIFGESPSATLRGGRNDRAHTEDL